ncbi:hypothetical protein DsansV1_C09g0091471 [Dioscorea sansibarensis]
MLSSFYLLFYKIFSQIIIPPSIDIFSIIKLFVYVALYLSLIMHFIFGYWNFVSLYFLSFLLFPHFLDCIVILFVAFFCLIFCYLLPCHLQLLSFLLSRFPCMSFSIFILSCISYLAIVILLAFTSLFYFVPRFLELHYYENCTVLLELIY